MGMVSTITISAITYDVYALTSNPVADADGYMAANADAAEWVAATTLQKQQAIITAKRAIDRESWSGEVLVDGQANKWPRTGATNNGTAVDDGTPDDIVIGEFELALSILKDKSVLLKNSTASNVSSVKAGSAQVSFFYPLPGSASRWPLPVNDLLAGYLGGAASGVDLMTPYVGGSGGADDLGVSDFTSADGERSEPLS